MSCPQMPISPVSLRNIKATDKTQRIFDGGGLYLEVTPKGKTWWRLKYRFNDKEKRIFLGVFPDVLLKWQGKGAMKRED
jgi:hypothetical protein